MLNKLLKGTDVAQILGISRALAYRLMAQGQITSVRFGRTVRVRLEDLEMFIRRNISDPLVQAGSEKVDVSNLEIRS
jgi:excisionase family DNA binding protein